MSTDKQQLEDKISNMEKELAEMKKILATPEPVSTYWTPDRYESYWYVNNSLQVQTLINADDLGDRYRTFATNAGAKRYADYIEAEETLKKAIAEANEGWLPNWSNSNELKVNVTLNHPESIILSIAYCCKTQPNFLYIKSDKLAQQLMNKYQNEFLTYLSY